MPQWIMDNHRNDINRNGDNLANFTLQKKLWHNQDVEGKFSFFTSAHLSCFVRSVQKFINSVQMN